MSETHFFSTTPIEPQSIAVDNEPDAPAVNVYRVLKHDSARTLWLEVGTLADTYRPDAPAIGEAFGEGEYLLIERDSSNGFYWAYPMRVVAETRYRIADDDE